MKCLVTGGCGFIGSHIVDRLIADGHVVTVIDDLSAPQNDSFYHNDKAEYHKLDISKDDASSLFNDVEVVFHLAARSRIQPTIKDPNECFVVNVIGTQRVLQWAMNAGVTRLIYSGTSSLYGHQNIAPFKPNMPSDCLNPYSLSKWMGEQVCKLYTQLHNMECYVLRYFNVYGPREPLKGQYAPVIGLFKRQIAEGGSMTIVGDGTQRRDFTYIDDVVDANMLASTLNFNNRFRIWNVGSGKNYSIDEVADMIGGKKVYVPSRPAEVKTTLADISDTVNELGWSPKHELIKTINSY